MSRDVGVAFNIFDTLKLPFDDAIVACEAEEGNLGSIQSVDEFLGVVTTTQLLDELNDSVWIGVRYAKKFKSDELQRDSASYAVH